MGQWYFPSDDSVPTKEKFAATMSVPQTLTTGVLTIIAFDTEEVASSHPVGVFGDATAGERVCPSAGVYLFMVNGKWGNSNVGNRRIDIWCGQSIRCYQVAAAFSDMQVSAIVYCNAGQNVYVQAWQNSGGNLDFGENRTRFTGVKLY